MKQAVTDDKRYAAGRDWHSWPTYEAATLGFANWWYPVAWANQVTGDPLHVRLCGEPIVLVRDKGRAYALHDRCVHRGVPLSEGRQEFPGTITCPYHAWTYDLASGDLVAVITDGPDSPMCHKAAVRTYACEERAGLVWVFSGGETPHPIDDQLPEEWSAAPFTLGGRIDERKGNWRFAAENGFDEGHAKYLHRTSLWRLFKAMPTWNKTHIEDRGRWIYRVQDEVHWRARFGDLGEWSNLRWWKLKPPSMRSGAVSNIGNTGGASKVDPVIAAQGYPGFASIALPGVLRIVYPQFIHYEFYVPVDEGTHRYVGVMLQFKTGLSGWWYRLRYLAGIRWLFHGDFSALDAWMVRHTDAPPERLYRPDSSLIAWRRLCESGTRPGGRPNEAVPGR